MQQFNITWETIIAPCYSKNSAKSISKNHTQEFQNIFTNLKGFTDALNVGIPLEQAKRTLPYIHNEKKGLLAVDQRPPKGGFQLRLYIYPDEKSHIIYIVTIGDKKSQQANIKTGYTFIQTLQK
ncbi:MAG: hypothetical protein MJZ76_07200 [Bacteroidales bacterium]|nr:hypothetical protein [Bacteroidales bacterium]